ncbi:uncharacterized protein LOC144438999 [Glandiceps talaboti]
MGCSPSSTKSLNITTLSAEELEKPVAKMEEENETKVFDYSLIKDDIDKINDVMNFLRTQTDFTNDVTEYETASKLIQLLNDYDSSIGREKYEQFSNYLAEQNYQDLYIKMHHQLHASVHGDRQSQITFLTVVGALDTAAALLGNTCDSSPEMCKRVGKAGVIGLLVDELEELKEYAATSKERDDRKDNYIETVLSILHNSIRLYDNNRPYFRTDGVVELFQYYLGLETIIFRALALLILPYIVDEEENDKINTGNENIEFLVTLLMSAVDTENHRETDYQFHVTELVDGMTKLAVNDANKVKFVELGVLPALVKLLQADCSLEEQRLAATALWTLAFHKDNKETIRNEAGCLQALGKLQKSSDKTLRKACNGALWELRGAENDELKSHQIGRKGHVMISYSWNVQGRMIQLKRKLTTAGYDVWMDIEKMGGSTLEAMADAVQNADAVLVCMSDKYKYSNPCRSEAEYTYKLQKPYIPIRVEPNYSPDGWLGILVGTRLYFDFSSDELLEKNFDNLVRELGEKGRLGDSVAVAKSYDVEVGATPPSTSTKSRSKRSVASWENGDVIAWLQEKGLVHLSSKFKRYSGRQILSLRKISVEAPEFFYAFLRKDLGLKDLYDIIIFKEALENLE